MDDRDNKIQSIAITVHGVGAKYFRKSVDSTETEQGKDSVAVREKESEEDS